MRSKWIVGAVIIVAAAILVFTSFSRSLTPYVSFAEAKEADKRVQVIGAVVKDQVRYDADSLRLIFDLIDTEHDSGSSMTVIYSGAMPGNFDQADRIVCKGQFGDGVFHADELLLKCPSKYEGES